MTMPGKKVDKRNKRFSINNTEQMILDDALGYYLSKTNSSYNSTVARALRNRIKHIRPVVRGAPKLSREKYRK